MILKPKTTVPLTSENPLFLKDLSNIVYGLEAKGVALKATEQPIDTSTAAGKALLQMLASLLSSRRTSAGTEKQRASPRLRQRVSTGASSLPWVAPPEQRHDHWPHKG